MSELTPISQLSRIPDVRSNLGLEARTPGWRGGTDRAGRSLRTPEPRDRPAPISSFAPLPFTGTHGAGAGAGAARQSLPKKQFLMGRGHARTRCHRRRTPAGSPTLARAAPLGLDPAAIFLPRSPPALGPRAPANPRAPTARAPRSVSDG